MSILVFYIIWAPSPIYQHSFIFVFSDKYILAPEILFKHRRFSITGDSFRFPTANPCQHQRCSAWQIKIQTESASRIFFIESSMLNSCIDPGVTSIFWWVCVKHNFVRSSVPYSDLKWDERRYEEFFWDVSDNLIFLEPK